MSLCVGNHVDYGVGTGTITEVQKDRDGLLFYYILPDKPKEIRVRAVFVHLLQNAEQDDGVVK